MDLNNGFVGQNVAELQRQLENAGYALPRWGSDGQFGEETFRAAQAFLLDRGIQLTLEERDQKKLRQASLLQLQAFLDALVVTTPTAVLAPPLIDRRAYASKRHDMGPRTWPKVTGWCLHQTACNLSASRDDARCDAVGAHFVVYPDGRIFWLHALNRVIVHGNAWNARTIGIEIDGLFAGVEGDAKTVWDDPSTPWHEKAGSVTPAQIAATMQLIRWGTSEVTRQGGKVTALVAHRQASGTRRNDPGSKVWQQIALPLAQELNLSDGGPGFKLNDGYAIPEAWNPAYKGIKY